MSHIVFERCIGNIEPGGEDLFSVVVKETYHLKRGSMVPAEEPEPIAEERRTRSTHNGPIHVTVRVPDLIPNKRAPDLVVLGTARRSPAVPEAMLTLQAGQLASHDIRITGPRVAKHRGDRYNFSMPDPWEEMPLTWDRAYGGVDLGQNLRENCTEEEVFQAMTWHPGAYPRNDLGEGYITASSSWEHESVELPCLEWPDDLLTPERLVCPAPDHWHLQPRPAGFGWMEGEWFPRSVFLGVVTGPWPDRSAGSVPEERLGLIPEGTTEAMEPADEEQLFRPQFWQEAAPGLTLPGLEEVDAITLEGLDNNKATVVQIPKGRPVVQVPVPGSTLAPDLRLLTLLLDLDEGVVLRLWAAPVPLSVLENKGIDQVDDLMNLEVKVSFKEA